MNNGEKLSTTAIAAGSDRSLACHVGSPLATVLCRQGRTSREAKKRTKGQSGKFGSNRQMLWIEAHMKCQKAYARRRKRVASLRSTRIVSTEVGRRKEDRHLVVKVRTRNAMTLKKLFESQCPCLPDLLLHGETLNSHLQ